MNKKELDILEKAFSAQIDSAINNDLGIIQSKSKIVKKLAAEGYLKEVKIILGGRFPVTVRGYALTDLGSLTYCTSERCKEE